MNPSDFKFTDPPGFHELKSLKASTPCKHPGGIDGLIAAAYAEGEAIANASAELRACRLKLERARQRSREFPEIFPPPPEPEGGPEQNAAALAAAEGFAALGLFVDAWRVLEEELPADVRESAAAVAVKLRVLGALGQFGEALALAGRITPECPLPEREAAGLLFSERRRA